MILTDEISLFHMWVTFAAIAIVILLFIYETLSIEITSVLSIAALVAIFHLFPLHGEDGQNLLDAHALLSGFANPALITVISLIIVGRALIQTGALSQFATFFSHISRGRDLWGFATILIAVSIIAAFMNNTPVVVIFIPILMSMAQQSKLNVRQMLMPLSFVSILGGMTTLIGSSTNLLVSRSLSELDLEPLRFFEFTSIGAILAIVGLIYAVFILPKFLSKQGDALDDEDFNGSGRQFIAHLKLDDSSPLVGKKPIYGFLKERPDVTVLMIWREAKAILPPFSEISLKAGDTMVIGAPRDVLTDAGMQKYGLLPEDEEGKLARYELNYVEAGHREVVEAMIPPGSPLINGTLRRSHFATRYRCLALGIQRRAHMIRTKMTDITFQAGDVLLLYGAPNRINELSDSEDLALLQHSGEEMPVMKHARRSLLIFLGFVGLAISELVPIVVAALLAVCLMILVKAIRLRTAIRSIDFKLISIVAVSLALGTSLELSGGAVYIAENVLMHHLSGMDAAVMLSAFFFIVMIFTNLISNNACAVLFTPIGVHLALATGIDPHIFAIATLFAANCSFCSPIGYQTNLLVMGPGRYRFSDFLKFGTPLALIIWVAFSFIAPIYYGL
ncbi:SLC13 family permease [Curvivirga aplysinae]|uniref:SLC13 family permease n=1 Tax=Curvivirga aplysinae TaxID=2529852 RepID=UPI0012BC4922|nr:SLC13 family permease [Curvivirga aplysinae]MTI08437.1 SLC13 family permease [Curvivirga aplysinae]